MTKSLFVNSTIEKEAFFENELFFAVFDIHPISPGHAIIIPKEEIVNFEDLNEQLWMNLRTTIRAVISTIEDTDLKKVYKEMVKNKITDNSVIFCNEALQHPRINTKPDAYNQGINDGKAAGRTVDHLHWHIIPRYNGDVTDPRGGIRYIIPDKGNYKLPRNSI